MSQFVTLNRIMKDDYHYNEAIKTLRTNIQFCGSGIKTIMLTSSLPDEGKSDITFAMASSLAQIGKKVVMIFAGPYSPNPAELLEESLFGDMISKLKERYDYIIVDTPPMGNLIDGAIVARQCDGAVMVIESGSISYRLEQRVKGQLEKSGCRILGVVLNKVNMERNGYYSKYYGKYGKYSKYGHYGKYDRYGKAEA